MDIDSPAALGGITVLDLTDSALQYCGKLFANMGADVVLVEPPSGCQARRAAPFVGGDPAGESLSFAYYNHGKRGVVIDLETVEGRTVLRDLAASADLVIESYEPGQLSALGVGADDLMAINPSLVVCSISPFGQSGPWAGHQAEDLTLLAAGGLLRLAGFPDRAPVAAWGDQAWLAGAQFAAVASLAALTMVQTERSAGGVGSGRHVDVSVQECVSMALENAIQFWDLEQKIRERAGAGQRRAGTGLFPCKDGMVYVMAGGLGSGKFWHAATEWLIEEQAANAEILRGEVWAKPNFFESDEGKALFASVFEPFAAARTKAELYQEGQKRRVPICPLSTIEDLLANPQLAHRGFFLDTTLPETGQVVPMPGAPYHLERTPWRAGAPAPRLGEHTDEVQTIRNLPRKSGAMT